MLYTLARFDWTDISTIGELLRGGKQFCYTLEDKDRDLDSAMQLRMIESIKVPGETCIPYGIYELSITPSARFKRLMPQVMNVPAFEGIRIHSGNMDKDTDGCVLLGQTFGRDFVSQSLFAFNELFPILTSDLARGNCQIEVVRRLVSVPVLGTVTA